MATDLRTLTRMWRRDLSWRKALHSGGLGVEGSAHTRRVVPNGRSCLHSPRCRVPVETHPGLIDLPTVNLYVLYMTYEPARGHTPGHVAISEARQDFANIVNRVAYRGERIRLMRHGRAVAAIVPIADVERLEQTHSEPHGDPRSAGAIQADADRAEIRSLIAMSDRDREAYFFASNRNVLRLIAEGRRSR
jgi:prevent-host-death family protein